jgi:hypothetical protein
LISTIPDFKGRDNDMNRTKIVVADGFHLVLIGDNLHSFKEGT